MIRVLEVGEDAALVHDRVLTLLGDNSRGKEERLQGFGHFLHGVHLL